MPRAADYTIQGFLYQFNKTALEILKAQDDDTITVEGILEDIEVTSSASLTAIQCKYHEASTTFTASAVYEPILKMLKHFSEHTTSQIRYVLFAYFPKTKIVDKPWPSVDKAALQAAMASNDKKLQKHVNAVPSDIDLDGFLTRFKMEFGPSYDDIVKNVATELEANGIASNYIETLTYPNTIHLIANLSVKHDAAARQTTKKKFLLELNHIHTTAISRWTLALKTRTKLLEAKRKQLKTNLDKNARLRCFVINLDKIENYAKEIVLFIKDFLEKYHSKHAHIYTPTLFLRASRDSVQDIQRRLFRQNIITCDGYVGGEFQYSYFVREPMKSKDKFQFQREFTLRILSYDDYCRYRMLNNQKYDDLFIIGELACDLPNTLDVQDVHVECLAGTTMKEIKYIFRLSDVYE